MCYAYTMHITTYIKSSRNSSTTDYYRNRLIFIYGKSFFQVVEDIRQNKGKDQIEHGRHNEGGNIEIPLHNGLSNTQNIIHRQDVHEGCVLQ